MLKNKKIQFKIIKKKILNKINGKLLVRRRRCDMLMDCVQTEVVQGVSINWSHMEKAVAARLEVEILISK